VSYRGVGTVLIHIHNQPVTLTDETIDKTWRWFADHQRACATAATLGEFRVNDLSGYVADCLAEAARYDQHEGRMSLTFIQRAYFIQSGESVPMLQ